MHKASMQLMRYFRKKYINGGETILDIGSRRCGKQETYGKIFKGCEYTGMDIVPGENVDIVGFENIKKSYDVVISGQTMEHVKRPWEWLRGIVKYYKKYICIIVPHTWVEHKYPIDTYRYMPDGMRDLFEYAGIIEIEIIKGKNDTVGIGGK